MVQAHLIDHPLVSTNLFLKFFKKMIFFFLMWTIFKVFIECVTILLLFYVLIFGPEILALASGMNPHPLDWKSKSQPLDSQGSPVIPSYMLNSQIPIDHALASFLQSILLIFPKLVNILIVPAL